MAQLALQYSALNHCATREARFPLNLIVTKDRREDESAAGFDFQLFQGAGKPLNPIRNHDP